MQTASELIVIRGETIIAHRYVAFLWVKHLDLLFRREVLSNVVDISVSILNEGSHLRDVSLGNSSSGSISKSTIG